MAEIDKSLPNVKQTINVPSPDEVQVEIQEEQKEQDQPIDVQENEDGSVDINFDPSKLKSFKKILNEFKINQKVMFTHSVNFDKLILIMNNCSFVLGNESGPICIGAALRKKILSIYYPKHTNKSSKTIYNKVKFFNTDMISSKKIISNILKILK